MERQVGLGRLPEEALTENGLEALSAYIGMDGLVQVDRGSHSFAVYPGDRIVLVSDGVYDTITEPEMAEALLLPGQQAVNADEISRVMSGSISGTGQLVPSGTGRLPAGAD